MNASSLSRNESEKNAKRNFNTRIIMKFKPTDYGKPLLKIIIILHCMQVCGSGDAMAYWVEMNERRWVIQITVRRTWEGIRDCCLMREFRFFFSRPQSSSTPRLIYSSSHSTLTHTHTAHRMLAVVGGWCLLALSLVLVLQWDCCFFGIHIYFSKNRKSWIKHRFGQND